MKNDEAVKKIKTKPRSFPYVLGAIVLLLLTFLVILQSSNLWQKLSVDSADDTLILYALSSLNFIAFIIFGFIFARNILKLTRERRALQLGSKIKIRLLVYFCAVSLLPLIAMAVFSYLFMNRAIERWFTKIPENVVRQAGDVEKQAIKNQSVMLRETANMLTLTLKNPTQQDLNNLLQAGNLTRIEILGKKGEILLSAEKYLTPIQRSELEKIVLIIRQNNFSSPILTDGEGFDATIAKFSDGKILLIVPDLKNTENLGQIVDKSLMEFDRLKDSQMNVRLIGLTTLGLLTLLLIFASSWTAFYVAKGLTLPIKSLAEGADEIARGNFGHRVDVDAEDELELLVASFNQMSAKLGQNAAELGARRKYIETVLQTLSTGVISFDDENRITTINKAAKNILRLGDGEFSGFHLDKIVGAETRNIFEKLIARAKRIGQASEQTVLQKENSDGGNEKNEVLPVALFASALPDKDGTVLVIEDLSELIAAQRASAWSEVAKRMAHEIKNPLTPIQLSAERISKNFKRSIESGNGIHVSQSKIKNIIDESTSTILREVQSLKSMVDEFSRFARLPNAELESRNLNMLIEQSVNLFEDREVKIELNLAENLPNLMLDREQIKRVFVNLIENALEAFDKLQGDKRISIKTFYDTGRSIVVTEISDNGNGIAPSDFQKLFQPYFSTKNRGTGLGLAIVQRIIIDHNGKIRVGANIPKGAKFTIEFLLNSF